MKIEVLTAPDEARLNRLARIHAEAFALNERGWTGEEIASLMETGRLIAAEDDSGFALISLASDESELLTLATAPENRRKGLGRALLDEAIKAAREAGAEVMFLEVAEDNEAAIMLYRMHGFQQTGKRPRYYRRKDGSIDALLFTLAL